METIGMWCPNHEAKRLVQTIILQKNRYNYLGSYCGTFDTVFWHEAREERLIKTCYNIFLPDQISRWSK